MTTNPSVFLLMATGSIESAEVINLIHIFKLFFELTYI